MPRSLSLTKTASTCWKTAASLSRSWPARQATYLRLREPMLSAPLTSRVKFERSVMPAPSILLSFVHEHRTALHPLYTFFRGRLNIRILRLPALTFLSYAYLASFCWPLRSALHYILQLLLLHERGPVLFVSTVLRRLFLSSSLFWLSNRRGRACLEPDALPAMEPLGLALRDTDRRDVVMS